MRSFTRSIKLMGLALLASVSISAQAQLNLDMTTATGDSKGGSTYSAMFREFAKACPNLNLRERESNGSIDNFDLLTGNKVKMAWVQGDVAFYTKMLDPAKVENVRALFSLFNEELHFISKVKTRTVGKFAALGIGDKVEVTKLSDLRGKTLGAVGGSIISAKIVNAKTGLNMNIASFPKNQDLLDALVSGKIDAILVVGGAPHNLPKALDTSYRLMSVDQEFMKPLSEVYTPAKLSYANMAQVGVDTVATPAIAVTRIYSKKVSEQLQKVQQCFNDHVEDLQSSDGTHEKWQKVKANAPMKWPAYDFK